MKKKIIPVVIVCLLISIAAFSSAALQNDSNTVDISALRTEIAQTVISEIYSTMNAQYNIAATNNAIDITATPVPASSSSTSSSSGTGTGFIKPTPTTYSYMAKFISQDKNYMRLENGTSFDVTWIFQNVGPLDWDKQFYLRWYKGMVAKEGTIVFLPYAVAKGDKVSIKLNFHTPDSPGIYNSYWELIDNDGAVIADNIWVGIQVY